MRWHCDDDDGEEGEMVLKLGQDYLNGDINILSSDDESD